MSRGAQGDHRNLHRSSHADRRAPVAAASANIECGRAYLVAARKQAALLEFGQIVPGPYLTAVGVTTEHQRHVALGCFMHLARLMSEEHQRRIGLPASEGGVEIGAVASPAVGAPIVDASEAEFRVWGANIDALIT